MNSDLLVQQESQALEGQRLDLVITGSIAAVESIRLIRSLRRLGASLHAALSKGAMQFITPEAVEWACGGRKPLSQLSGSAEHIAQGDACIVAPASANFISKIAMGLCDDPSSTLVHSYLGLGKPLILFPSMHESLAANPFYQENLQRLLALPNVSLMPARLEEGKRKIPEPAEAADHIAHVLNRRRHPEKRGMILAYGGSQAAIDDVRHIGNYSSGALGYRLAKESYRQGYEVHLVRGITELPCPPCNSVVNVKSNDEFKYNLHALLESKPFGLVMMAALLDFVPSLKETGKIASQGKDSLDLHLVATEKVISSLEPQIPVKVGFKLESPLSDNRLQTLWDDKARPLKLSLLLANDFRTVKNSDDHTVYAMSASLASQEARVVKGKTNIAKVIIEHFDEYYQNHRPI